MCFWLLALMNKALIAMYFYYFMRPQQALSMRL